MRSVLRIACLLSAAALVATACNSGGEPEGKVAADAPVVKVLMIGYPDKDGLDPTTGNKVPGIGKLEEEFAAANSDVKLDIVNIPWGSGATGYAPKTEAMIKTGEACLYEMPAAADYGRRGALVNLDTLIEKDTSFKNVWGSQLDDARSWGPDDPKSLWYIPNNTGERVIHWDAKLFKDFGVEPLSQEPTLEEIEEKAAKLTGKNPVTGEDTYGYWYQGKYAVWQFMAIAHALGANWGASNPDGTLTIKWDTPEYLRALEWFATMAKYAPKGALAAEGMPQGFPTDKNVVAIIPEGEPGYFLQALISTPDIQDRFRVSYNLKGPDGRGGLSSLSPLAMAEKCKNKDAAWKALKWLASSPESQQYYFDSIGRLPVVEGAEEIIPKVAELPDGEVILNQPQVAEASYPWAAEEPRWAMQAALEGVLAGKLTPEQALQRAQKETDDWLAKQGPGK
jgi:multiple sugar transport system substrate-binding protein